MLGLPENHMADLFQIKGFHKRQSARPSVAGCQQKVVLMPRYIDSVRSSHHFFGRKQ
ncbi:hypothetical protein HMPREF9371_0804 [Neisseria shayeganii 871]|uniref:Uncharacterized protein n=1 Tax=Neisseria shayeganii 871 TaxID=1032488 RepID=G4CGR5_9NEIS|nr:hypothetical protein HMPREF9371_0804 [Neisseria shayeganii 871]